MLIGILADTHDRIASTRAALSLLRGAGAQVLFHCGDVGSEEILDELAGNICHFVWGNNDWERPKLARYAQTLELACHDSFGSIELAGKRIAITHGDDTRTIKRVTDDQSHDYLFTGHTHVPHDHRHGRVRWINPGALHRARTLTVATLDLLTDELRLLPVATS